MFSPAKGFPALPWHDNEQAPNPHLSSFALWLWDTETLPQFRFPQHFSSLQCLTFFWVCSFNVGPTHNRRRYLSMLPFHSLTAPVSPQRHDSIYPSADFFLCYSHSSGVGGGEASLLCLSLSLSLIANDHIDFRRAECPVSIPREDCLKGFSLFHFPFKDSFSFSLGMCCCNQSL